MGWQAFVLYCKNDVALASFKKAAAVYVGHAKSSELDDHLLFITVATNPFRSRRLTRPKPSIWLLVLLRIWRRAWSWLGSCQEEPFHQNQTYYQRRSRGFYRHAFCRSCGPVYRYPVHERRRHGMGRGCTRRLGRSVWLGSLGLKCGVFCFGLRPPSMHQRFPTNLQSFEQPWCLPQATSLTFNPLCMYV